MGKRKPNYFGVLGGTSLYVDKIYVDQIGTPLSAGVTTAGGTNIGTDRHKRT